MNTQNNNNRQQNIIQLTVAQQQASYDCSKKLHLQQLTQNSLDQTADTALFNRDPCIENYALVNSGSDNAQITKKVADELHVQRPKYITLPLVSLHGEHSVNIADVMIGTELLYDSCRVIGIAEYATATEFWIPRVEIEMLNEISRDHSHLQNISFPTIRCNRIGILIGADAFTAIVSGQYPPGTASSWLTLFLVRN